MYRKYLILFLLLSFSLFLLPAIVNFAIDPFHIFRKPFARKVVYNKNQRYQVAGLIKNHDFDSIIIGTSMSENSRATEVSEILGWKQPIKLCISGLKPKNINFVLNYALSENKNVKNIIMDLHWYFISENPDEEEDQHDFPSYLYSSNIMTLHPYVFNSDTFKESYKIITGNLSGYVNTPDELGIWYKEVLFRNYNKPENIASLKNKLKIYKNTYDKHLVNYKFQYPSFDKNVLPLLGENPNINFYFFLPPYSRYYYASDTRQDFMKRLIYFRKHVITSLSKFPNAKLFGFDNEVSIVESLSNYKDYGHYDLNINRVILESIAKGSNQLTKENIDDYLLEMIEGINNYSL